MIDVIMPQMGESIVEGTLTKWLKKPGESVERDEPLFEISTDKVDTEIPSPVAGTLGEILVQEGTTVGINTVVGRISDGAAAPAAAPAAAAAPAPAVPAPASCSYCSGSRTCRPKADPGSGRGTVRRRNRWTAIPARAQNGAREQYRLEPGARDRRRRAHHQAGSGSVSRSTHRRPGPGCRSAGASRASATAASSSCTRRCYCGAATSSAASPAAANASGCAGPGAGPLPR